jgi:hypothetical protein
MPKRKKAPQLMFSSTSRITSSANTSIQKPSASRAIARFLIEKAA